MNDNFGMKEGGRPPLEPCVIEDMDKIGRLNKDALAILAKKKFNLNIDRGENISILRGNLVKKVQIALNIRAADPEIDAKEKVAIQAVIPQYVKHPVNLRIFEATPTLLLRPDMIPCDVDGNPVHFQYVPPVKKAVATNELDRLSLDLERQVIQ